MNVQKRHWCFTAYAGHLGLDDDFSFEEIIDAMRSHWESVNDLPGIRYAIAQIEKCPTSQRLHIQGYLEFKDSKRMNTIYKMFPANLEYRKGSRDDARDYCRKKKWKGKDKGQVQRLPEFGEWRKERVAAISPKQRAIEMLKRGFSPEQILRHDLDAYFTHYKAIESVYRLMLEGEIDFGNIQESLITHGEEE